MSGTPRGGAFSIKIVIALLFVGAFSFSAFMVLSAFAPDFMSGNDGREHALSRSAIGFAGAAKLTGATISRSRTTGAAASLVVLTPDRIIEVQDIDDRSYSNALVILPKWIVAPHRKHPGWVTLISAAEPPDIDPIIAKIAPKTHLARGPAQSKPKLTIISPDEPHATHDVQAGAITDIQTLQGEGITPVVMTPDGGVLLARVEFPKSDKEDEEDYRYTNIYILADPDFLNTQGIADEANARAGLAMLDALHPAHGSVAFDVTLNGFERDRSLMKMAFTPPFLAATLSLAAAALLLAWRAVTQDTPRKPEGRAIALGKTALTDNSAGLIRMARREHKMGWGYAQLIATLIAERIGAGRGDASQTVASLDRFGANHGITGAYSDLAAEASAAENTAQIVQAARKLHAWREDAIRATD